jgi:hypothetical protein
MMADSNAIWDGYVGEGEVVTITPPGKHYSIPYICFLRHGHFGREFEELRSPVDRRRKPSKLTLNVDENGDPGPDIFVIAKSNSGNFPGWHYNKLGKYTKFDHN